MKNKSITSQLFVIKVGTSTLTHRQEKGSVLLDDISFRRLGDQILCLRQNGHAVVIVSSAAITAGMSATNRVVRPTGQDSMPRLQALASIGWRHVLNAWSSALPGVHVGELLITAHDLERQAESSELVRVTHRLLNDGCVPIVNENDALTHDEIAVGDNDTLAARFAGRLKDSGLFAQKISVILLSDIDGVYRDINDPTSVVRTIESIDEYEKMIHSSISDGGTGGMATKFQGARIAHEHGIDLTVANGRTDEILTAVVELRAGTRFIKSHN